MKNLILDMDGVISESRTPASSDMIIELARLAEKYRLCVISGGTLSLMKYQFLDRLLGALPQRVYIDLLPTSGLAYYRTAMGEIVEWYFEEMQHDLRIKIVRIASEVLKKSATKPITLDVIEDRQTQITISVLGRSAPLEDKKRYDPLGTKRKHLVTKLKRLLPSGLSIKIGGTTSIDITEDGKDKGYGLNSYRERTGIRFQDSMYIGDSLHKGGNDYPAKLLMPETSFNVNSPEEALKLLKSL